MRILYIDIDTLRADHMGCYGYHRDTSPNIDELARQGVCFDNCYASDAPCLPSRTALWSGRFGFHTGVVNHGGTAADPFIEGNVREKSLAEIWASPDSFGYNRRFSKTLLNGACADCRWGDACRGGCREIAYSYSADPFSPPFCLHQLEREGKLVKTDARE